MPVMLLGNLKRRDEIMTKLVKPFITPANHNHIPDQSLSIMIGSWLVIGVLGLWGLANANPAIFPTPLDVVTQLPSLWVNDGLGSELITSILTGLEALVWSVLIAFPVAYLCRVLVVRPLAIGISKIRFLSPMVFFAILLFSLSSGHQVKVAMLVIGMVTGIVTDMVGVVESIPTYQYDDAATLRMGPWQSLWYVTIRGTVPNAVRAIRTTSAASWAMIIMVEGAVRMDGGIGKLIADKQKHLEFASCYVMITMILLYGILQDWVIRKVEEVSCPYVN